MKLDLRNIPIFWINSEFATDRREKMIQLFERCGFKKTHRIDAVIHENKVVGCALSHIKALCVEDPYFIVMEDDIQETSDLKMEIEIPEDFDAFYLGTSYWPNEINRARSSLLSNSTQKKKINEDIYQISHMTALHAVLYKNGDYNKAAAKNIYQYLFNPNGNLHCDVVTAELQSSYKVYAASRPFFYQEDKNNPDNKFWTLKPLKEFE
jgi:hypothetical protein